MATMPKHVGVKKYEVYISTKYIGAFVGVTETLR